MTILQAIQALLSDDATCVSNLAQWDFGDGLVPAIFVRDPAPEKCGQPLVTLREDGGANGPGVVINSEWQWSGTIMVWGNKDESDATPNVLAWAIARALDRASVTVTGFETSVLACNAPSGLTDPDGFPGYRLTVAAIFRSEV